MNHNYDFLNEDLGDCDDEYVNELLGRLEYPPEFEDYKKVMQMGADKHGANNWLDANGSKSSFKQMHDSMFHHLAESYGTGYIGDKDLDELFRYDEESGLDPLLHLICRAQMMYTRIKRGIQHSDDNK